MTAYLLGYDPVYEQLGIQVNDGTPVVLDVVTKTMHTWPATHPAGWVSKADRESFADLQALLDACRERSTMIAWSAEQAMLDAVKTLYPDATQLVAIIRHDNGAVTFTGVYPDAVDLLRHAGELVEHLDQDGR